MLEPNLTWYILNEKDEEIPASEYYAGNYNWNDTVNLKARVWNNRWGDDDVQNAKDLVLEISFFYIEQNILLKEIEVFEDGYKKEIQHLEEMVKVRLDKTLSGQKHSINEFENDQNYVDIEINIPINHKVKSEVKNMVISMDYDRGDN